MTGKKMISLLAVFFLIIGYVKIYSEDSVKENILKTISVKDSLKMINDNKTNKNFIIIDIRTPVEFSGPHIAKSINIDYYAKDFKDKLNKLDKTKKYLIYCRTGHRSGLALEIMRELKFNEVYNMAGGITVWISNNYPVINK